jgi:hypothetical protein
MAEGEQTQFGTESLVPIVYTSQPKFILRHSISDEELEMLCEGRKDFALEILWTGLGILGGSLPAAVATIYRYFNAPAEYIFAIEDFLQVILFVIGLSIAVVAAIISFNRNKRSKSLEQAIRERSNKISQEQ